MLFRVLDARDAHDKHWVTVAKQYQVLVNLNLRELTVDDFVKKWEVLCPIAFSCASVEA